MQARDPPWLWNPGEMSPEVQNKVSVAPPKALMSSKLKKKNSRNTRILAPHFFCLEAWQLEVHLCPDETYQSKLFEDITTTRFHLYCWKISMRNVPTLSRGPRVRPRVVKIDLSLKSGSLPIQDIIGLFQNEASSATGFKAGIHQSIHKLLYNSVLLQFTIRQYAALIKNVERCRKMTAFPEVWITKTLTRKQWKVYNMHFKLTFPIMG